jgi:ATP diphosphatase
LREEVDELAAATDDPAHAEEEVGDVLFATVALARKLGVDAESALRRTVRGFSERYERFMSLAAEHGLDVATADEAELRALFRAARAG